MHVNAVIAFAAVSLKVKFAKFLLLIGNHELMLKLALLALREDRKSLQTDPNTKPGPELWPYLDAAPLQEVFADVSTVVLDCVLIDELLAHDRSFLVKAWWVLSILTQTNMWKCLLNEGTFAKDFNLMLLWGSTYSSHVFHSLVASSTSSSPPPRLPFKFFVLVDHSSSSSWSAPSSPSSLSDWKYSRNRNI